MTKEIIIDGCEFQSDCIEYKDISYLKIMPICAIYELSIACHDKENKCKYYKVYKQLKRLEFELKVTRADYEASEQENERLKEEVKIKDNISEKFRREALSWANIANEYQKDKTKLKHTLQEIKEIAENYIKGCVDCSLIAEPYECEDCTGGGMTKLGKIILDLITKAEEE